MLWLLMPARGRAVEEYWAWGLHSRSDAIPFEPGMLSESDMQDVAELLIRPLLDEHDASKACFVGIVPRPRANSDENVDEAGRSFAERFRDLPFPVRNHRQVDTTTSVNREPESSKPAVVYIVHFESRVGSDVYRVLRGKSLGSMSLMAHVFKVHKLRNGEWEIVAQNIVIQS